MLPGETDAEGPVTDVRAGLRLRFFDRMEIENGWCYVAKHTPGRANTPTDEISRLKSEESSRGS